MTDQPMPEFLPELHVFAQRRNIRFFRRDPLTLGPVLFYLRKICGYPPRSVSTDS